MNVFSSLTVVAATVLIAPAHATGMDQAQVREAVSKSIAALQSSQEQWKIPCLSCHHQSLPMVVYHSARTHGVTVDEQRVRAHAARTFRMLAGYETALQMPLDAFAFGYALLALEGGGIDTGLTAPIVARRFAYEQHADGHWGTNDARPPHSYSPFTTTALALRAIDRHLPAIADFDRQKQFGKARQWLATNKPISTEDSTFRLLGITWAGGAEAERRHAAADLLQRQLADGGWGQMPGLAGDAYSTGEALVALSRSGMLTASDEPFRRGIQYLLKTQREDGAWLVQTRLRSKAQISPPFFESGFPGGRDQFISFAATNWAAMALLESLPPVSTPAKPLDVLEAKPKTTVSWAHTALFGTAEDLRKLLDAGLDANAATANGVTLLMFAAPDVAKMTLLIERGANVNAVATGGNTALSLMATYRSGGPGFRMLLDAGAKVDKAASPLSVAAMAGNVEAVKLLLERGADPRGNPEAKGPGGLTPLMGAVMAGEPEIAALLVKRGAQVNARDEQGMTPLMWAALVHKTSTVRTLLDLGADPLEVSKFGQTPLGHTSDIGHLDPETEVVLRSAMKAREDQAAKNEPARSGATN